MLQEDETKRMFYSSSFSDSVYSVSFSPNGQYLASGSFDKNIFIWSIKEGKCIKSYKSSGMFISKIFLLDYELLFCGKFFLQVSC